MEMRGEMVLVIMWDVGYVDMNPVVTARVVKKLVGLFNEWL